MRTDAKTPLMKLNNTTLRSNAMRTRAALLSHSFCAALYCGLSVGCFVCQATSSLDDIFISWLQSKPANSACSRSASSLCLCSFRYSRESARRPSLIYSLIIHPNSSSKRYPKRTKKEMSMHPVIEKIILSTPARIASYVFFLAAGMLAGSLIARLFIL